MRGKVDSKEVESKVEVVEGGFKRVRVHNDFKSEHLRSERKVCFCQAMHKQLTE